MIITNTSDYSLHLTEVIVIRPHRLKT